MKNPNHSNKIELLGRNHLIAQLIKGGVHAALPMWDQGVDLIAYYEGERGFVARPLQLKVSKATRWGVYKKYAETKDLLIVHIWHVEQSSDVEIYAMSYAEAEDLLNKSSTYATCTTWTKDMGHYDTANITPELRHNLQEFRMSEGKWQKRLECS
ncbi:MAG TPA: hypothetical protein VFC39_14985 [Acidobacteriaceae bacterium]|nr:hypothetical protein [Acidobacteriaceae bacterium]